MYTKLDEFRDTCGDDIDKYVNERMRYIDEYTNLTANDKDINKSHPMKLFFKNDEIDVESLWSVQPVIKN